MATLFKNRLTIGLIVFYALGIFIGARLFSNLYITLSMMFTVLFAALGIFCPEGTKRAVSFGIALCFVFLAIGTHYSDHIAANRQKELRSFIGKDCYIYGTVISSPKLTQKGNHYSVTVDVYKIKDKDKETLADGRILVYVSRHDNTRPKINQSVSFYASLQNPDHAEGDFNYNEFLRTRDTYATAFTQRLYSITGQPSSFSPIEKIKYAGREINVFFSEKTDKLFSFDKDERAMLKGILLGDRGDFSKELTDNLSLAGFSHIVAVSGLHLNILFGVLCGLLGCLRFNKRAILCIALPITLLFASITGFSPSICRAVIMLIIYIMALLLKREYDSLNALFVSAFIILIVNPYALFSVSFILSFSSTLFIILFYEKLFRLFSFKKNPPMLFKGIAASLSVSFSAFVGTAPVIAYYFGIISLSSLIANIWVVPLCGPILVLGYSVCLISSILPVFLSELLLMPLCFWLEILIQTANLFANISFLHFNVPRFSPVFLVFYYAVIAIISILWKKRHNSL